MNKFVDAVIEDQKFGETLNGGVSYSTSGKRVLDLFGAIGNRNAQLNKEFDLAAKENLPMAYRVLLWARDIRGGAGERQTFRNLLLHLEDRPEYQDDLIRMLPYIPAYGRWDDLLIFKTDRVRSEAFDIIAGALEAGDSLCAKWMPRKGEVAVALREHLGMSPKQYRKTLVELTKVVESQMCSGDWDNIVYDHVPSLASARYQKAFYRHSPEKYKEYRDGLSRVKEDGTTERKINAGAVFPYDVIKSLRNGDGDVAEAQWKALPNYLGDNKIIPMVDVSGSMMSWSYYAQRTPIKSGVTPMDISTSIGLYVAEKQQGPFHGMFLSFSTNPKLQKLNGSLKTMYNEMIKADWGQSTDVISAFKKILTVAVANKVPQEEMPDTLLILSDMEFNPVPSWYVDRNIAPYDKVHQEKVRELYKEYGYTLPKVIYWNINGRADNSPVRVDDIGTALVSGFSPAIFKAILKVDFSEMTPESIMRNTVMVPRYNIEGLTV